jgi:diaminohydroxyphosphoribosylaminopyrimidine deaminase / 5-amino-6-(5-phosphoribosylamino)uracil reductase
MATEVMHEVWMRKALDLALHGTGKVSPNPRVGCVIVHNNEIIAEGWHERYGELHAEAAALATLSGKPPANSTMYVTLEPCDHVGKREPCTEAILASGIEHVVVAVVDPNPLVAGRGVNHLRAAGVQVHVGTLAEEAAWMNRTFFHHITTGSPYVILKMAQSLDGVIAPEPAARLELTGSGARARVHALRAEVDAVMVGSRTVVVDDPHLTVRDVAGRDPARIIVDPLLDVPHDTYVMRSARDVPTTIIASSLSSIDRRRAVETLGAEVIIVDGTGLALDLASALKELGARQITSIMCEGGPFLANALLAHDHVHEMRIHIAPILLGSGHGLHTERMQRFSLRSTEHVDDDVLLTYVHSRTT